MIKVSPSDGHYWDTKHGNFVAGIRMLIGVATGVILDDSIQGIFPSNINPEKLLAF